MNQPTTASDTTFSQLSWALAGLRAHAERASMLSLLLPSAALGMPEDGLVRKACEGVDEEMRACIEEAVAARTKLLQAMARQQQLHEQRVSSLLHTALTELGFAPKPGRHKRRLPAWTCSIPHERGHTMTTTVTGISHLLVDRRGRLLQMFLDVSKHDDGCGDSLTVVRDSRDELRALEPVSL